MIKMSRERRHFFVYTDYFPNFAIHSKNQQIQSEKQDD